MQPNDAPDNKLSHDQIGVVQVTRTSDPVAVSVSPEAQRRHELSKEKYPFLNLSGGEYVILDVERHPIGLVAIWLVVLVLVVMVTFLPLIFFPAMSPLMKQALGQIFLIIGLVDLLFVVGGWIFTSVYNANRLLLTNESLIQEVQMSPFSSQEKTINLENVKDISFKQTGIIQQLFGYGRLKASTEGDAQEYDYSFVARPKQQTDIIANVIEAVKYGRPIDTFLKD